MEIEEKKATVVEDQIVLKYQKHFWLLDETYEAIVKNFCLLSYVNTCFGLEITHRHRSILSPNIFIDQVNTGRDKNFIFCTKRPDNLDDLISNNQGVQFECFLVEEGFQSVKKRSYRENEAFKKKKQEVITKNMNSFLLQRFIPETKDNMKKLREMCETEYEVKYGQHEHMFKILFYLEDTTIWESEFGNLNRITVKISKQSHDTNNQYKNNIKFAIKQSISKPQSFQPPLLSNILYNILQFEDFSKKSASERWLPSFRGNQNSKKIEYFYLQPHNERDKVYNEDQSYVIALQGGGAKGISYVGAWKAFSYWLEEKREQNQKIKSNYKCEIRTVIGSSVGAILGLAIACDLTYEEIKGICLNHFPTLMSGDKITPEKRNQILGNKAEQYHEYDWKTSIKAYFNKLKNQGIISDYLETALITLIDNSLEKILTIMIKKFFPFLKELLLDESKKLDLNQLFLVSAMMTGQKMKEANVDILSVFMKKKFEKVGICNLKDQELNAWIEKQLTMEKFYQLTNRQFIATSVDLHDHRLRFFCHRTTPKLPVCQAVRMSGSFPTGFLPQKWLKEKWGSYVIHYKNSKRELNLDGHQFTDGGMLSNFPIQYLDNESIRTRYMSHPHSDSSKRKIIGFEIESDPQKIVKDQEEKSILQEFFNILKEEAPIKQIFKAQLKTFFGRNQNRQFNAQEIPLIGFLFNLLETYIYTKDNLTREIFAFERKLVDSSAFQRESQLLKNFSQSDTTMNIEVLLIDRRKQYMEKMEKEIQLIQEKLEDKTDIQAIRKNKEQILDYECIAEAVKLGIPRSSQIFNYSEEQVSILLHLLHYKFKKIGQLQGCANLIQEIEYNHQKLTKKGRRLGYQQIKLFLQMKTKIDPQNPQNDDLLCPKSRETTQNKNMFVERKEYLKNNHSTIQVVKCILKQNLKYLQKYIDEVLKNPVEERSLRKCLQKIENIIHPFYFLAKQILCQNSSIIEQLGKIKSGLSSIRKETIFYSGKLKHDLKLIKQKTEHLKLFFFEQVLKKKFCKDITCSTSTRPQDCPYFGVCKILCTLYIRQKKYIENCIKKWKDIGQNIETQETSYNRIQKLYMKSKHVYSSTFQQNKLFFNIMKKSLLEEVSCCNELYKNYHQNQQYFNSRIHDQTQSKSKKTIHLVLQSHSKSSLFINEFIEQAKKHAITNNTRISTITGSNTNAMVMFLHAIGLPNHQIKEKLNIYFKQVYQFNVQSIQKFDGGQWLETNSTKIHRLMKELGDKLKKENLQKVVNQEIENMHIGEGQGEIQKEVKEMKQMFDEIISLWMEAFEDSTSNGQIDQKKLRQALGIDNPDFNDKWLGFFKKIAKDASKKEAQKSAQLKRIFKELLQYSKPLLIKVMNYFPSFVQFAKYKTFHKKKQLWKAIILAEAITKQNTKSFIQKEILEKTLFVNPNFNLSQLYNYMPQDKRILLNFSTIDLKQKIINFVNAKTCPYMPVHAAVRAAISFPFFASPKIIDKEWNIRQQSQIEMKQLDYYFSKRISSDASLVSADILTVLPLHLLTNQKIKDYNHLPDDQIFCSLGYRLPKEDKKSCNPLMQELKMKKESEKGEIGIKKIIQYRQMAGLFSELKVIPFINNIEKLYKVHMSTYDLLMIKMYKEQSIKLPTRIGTLDFKSLFKSCNGNGAWEYSKEAEDLIEQSQYVMKEKLKNFERNFKSNLKPLNKTLYLKVQRETPLFISQQDQKKLKQRRKQQDRSNEYDWVWVRFLSAENKSKSLEEKINVQFLQQEINSEFQELKVPKSNKGKIQLSLKIDFPQIQYELQEQRPTISNQRIKKFLFDIKITNLRQSRYVVFGIPYSSGIQAKGIIKADSYNQQEQNQGKPRVEITKVTPIKISGHYPNHAIHCPQCFREGFKSIPPRPDQICEFCLQPIKQRDNLQSEQAKHCYTCNSQRCLKTSQWCIDCIFNSLVSKKMVKTCRLGHLNLLLNSNEEQTCEICEQKLVYWAASKQEQSSAISMVITFDEEDQQKSKIIQKYMKNL